MSILQDSLHQIFRGYGQQKAELAGLLAENRIYNAALKQSGLDEETYKKARRRVQIKDYSLAHLIASGLPRQIASSAALSPKEYIVEGSIGKGNTAEIPWICIFDRSITISAEQGYYIVLLFTKDSKGAYLSFNQGCTQYFENAKALGKKKKDAFALLRRHARASQKILRSTAGFDFAPISLGGQDELAIGYEAGNICSKYYSLNNVPTDEEFIDDLRDLLGVYRELRGLVGRDIMKIEIVGSEEGFQEKVQEGRKKEIPTGPIAKKEKGRESVSLAYYRDPNMAYTALESADFRCEQDPLHETFLSSRNGKNFVEAHHLIPMEFQDEFATSIDVPENIVSLCPNCHRAFHNSAFSQRLKLIETFFKRRLEGLQSRGIEVEIERLKKFYITEERLVSLSASRSLV